MFLKQSWTGSRTLTIKTLTQGSTDAVLREPNTGKLEFIKQ